MGEEEERSWRKRARGPETPLGTAFRCRGRPTAEYCRRVVVMETGRQSRLFIGLDPPPPPSLQIPSQDRKPDCNLQLCFLWTQTKTGRAVQVHQRSVHRQQATANLRAQPQQRGVKVQNSRSPTSQLTGRRCQLCCIFPEWGWNSQEINWFIAACSLSFDLIEQLVAFLLLRKAASRKQ